MAFPAEGKITLRRAWDGITSAATRIKRIANAEDSLYSMLVLLIRP